MLFFDRSNEFNEKDIGLDKNGNIVKKTDLKHGNFDRKLKLKDFMIDCMKKVSEKKEGDIEFYYMGIPKSDSEKKGQIYQYVNGILKRDERF